MLMMMTNRDLEPQPLDTYPGGPYDMSVLTQYHYHVAKHMFNGEVRFSNLCFFYVLFFFM